MSDLEERVRRVLDHSELSNIRVESFSARRVSPAEASSVNVRSETSYACDEGTLGGRYEWGAQLVDDSGDEVADISVEIIVEFDVHEGYEPDMEAAENIAETTGYFASYPYVREFIQSSCVRLQLNPLVLGMLLRGATKPRTVTSPKDGDSLTTSEAPED